jgi:hypothetical protein
MKLKFLPIMCLMFTAPAFAQFLPESLFLSAAVTAIKAKFEPTIYKNRMGTPVGVVAGATRVKAMSWIKDNGYLNLPTAQANIFKSYAIEARVDIINGWMEEFIDETSCINEKDLDGWYLKPEKMLFTTRFMYIDVKNEYDGNMYIEKTVFTQNVLEANGFKLFGKQEAWATGQDVGTYEIWLIDNIETGLDKYYQNFVTYVDNAEKACLERKSEEKSYESSKSFTLGSDIDDSDRNQIKDIKELNDQPMMKRSMQAQDA